MRAQQKSAACLLPRPRFNFDEALKRKETPGRLKSTRRRRQARTPAGSPGVAAAAPSNCVPRLDHQYLVDQNCYNIQFIQSWDQFPR